MRWLMGKQVAQVSVQYLRKPPWGCQLDFQDRTERCPLGIKWRLRGNEMAFKQRRIQTLGPFEPQAQGGLWDTWDSSRWWQFPGRLLYFLGTVWPLNPPPGLSPVWRCSSQQGPGQRREWGACVGAGGARCWGAPRESLSSWKWAARGWKGWSGGGHHLGGRPALSWTEVGSWCKARSRGPSSLKGRKDFILCLLLVHHLPRLPFSGHRTFLFGHQAPCRLVQPGPGARSQSPDPRSASGSHLQITNPSILHLLICMRGWMHTIDFTDRCGRLNTKFSVSTSSS